MTLPTIHVNGSKAADLCEQYTKARNALEAAIEAMAAAGPNARDYYPQGDGAFREAQNTHRANLATLRAMIREVEEVEMYCADRM